MTYARQAIAALLCLSLPVWSVMPSATHTQAVFGTIQHHLEMTADHGHSHGHSYGHSHGLGEDLYRAIHGHSHDAADHDHTQAFLALDERNHPAPDYRDTWRPRASSDDGHRMFRIERPPRA